MLLGDADGRRARPTPRPDRDHLHHGDRQHHASQASQASPRCASRRRASRASRASLAHDTLAASGYLDQVKKGPCKFLCARAASGSPSARPLCGRMRSQLLSATADPGGGGGKEAG